MVGQISALNQLRTSSERVRSQLRTSSKLAPNMFGASSEPASVMEFGFNSPRCCASRECWVLALGWLVNESSVQTMIVSR